MEHDVQTNSESVNKDKKSEYFSVDFAKPGKRFQGQFIDTLITLGLLALSIYLVKSILNASGALADVAVLIAPVSYYLFSDALPHGQSLGKKILNMSVIHKETGKHCTLVQSMLRNVTTPFLGIFDSILIFLEGRQRAGDFIATTIVINKK